MRTEEPTAPTTGLNAHDVQTLRANLQGSALTPGDDGYDAARTPWAGKEFDQHPAIVVLPAVASDVVAAVNFAREHGLPVAVQSGGHGHPVPANGALLVNFANMSKVEVDAERGTARVQPGAKARDVLQATTPHGLAPLNGFAPTVGIVGFLLGGGIGWLTRQYGVGAGSIRSAEVVTADGRLLQVDEQNNPDLLWGLRGAGANFGVVTALEVGLYPVKEIFGGHVAYPVQHGREVLDAYVQWARTVPDELTSAFRVMHFPDMPMLPPHLRGKSVVMVLASYNGSAEEGEELLRPMRALATPLFDTFAQMPYSQVASISNDPTEAPPLLYHSESVALSDLSEGDVRALIDAASTPACGIYVIEIRHLGGALARQPEDAMPFGLRKTNFYLMAISIAPMPQMLAPGKQTMAELRQSLADSTTGEVVLNFALVADPDQTRAAFSPDNYRRLVALKSKYDPQNMFRFNHNIPPSTE